MGRYIRISTPNGVKRWRILQAKLPQNQHETNWGLCYYESRTIVIHSPLSPEELLATIIHEATHAACPDLSETAVCRIENSVAAALRPYLSDIADDLEG